MSKKIVVFLLATLIVPSVHLADAQQPKKVPRIGYLSPLSPSSDSTRTEAFRQGLRDLGYVERQNIAIEYRFAEGKSERLPDLAAELVRTKPDVIVTGSTVAALAVKHATATIPVVIANVGDPVASGLVASLARPGGNITGLSSMSPDLSGKRLELLKETVPRLTRVGVLWDPGGTGQEAQIKETEVAGRALGVQVQLLAVRIPEDFESAFKASTGGRAHALIILQTPLINTNRPRIVEFASENRLPTMWGEAQVMDAGGLMSYGPNFADMYRRAAIYVDKILKGRKPADLPVEQPMKFELVINLKTAKQIGLTIPPNVLARADKVIR